MFSVIGNGCDEKMSFVLHASMEIYELDERIRMEFYSDFSMKTNEQRLQYVYEINVPQ